MTLGSVQSQGFAVGGDQFPMMTENRGDTRWGQRKEKKGETEEGKTNLGFLEIVDFVKLGFEHVLEFGFILLRPSPTCCPCLRYDVSEVGAPTT